LPEAVLGDRTLLTVTLALRVLVIVQVMASPAAGVNTPLLPTAPFASLHAIELV
jgi:hypothetical protein